MEQCVVVVHAESGPKVIRVLSADVVAVSLSSEKPDLAHVLVLASEPSQLKLAREIE